MEHDGPHADLADDDRITAMGMLVEAHAALSGVLARDLDAECELPLSWFEVLLRLRRSPGHRLRMSELAAQVSFSTSGLTRLADRIEAAGLLRREACSEDRRGAFAVLTPAGADKVETALPVHLRGLQQHLAAPLAPGELATLTDLLRKVRDGLVGSGSEPCGGTAIPFAPSTDP